MNKAKYNSLAPDLKKVIDNNSGMATSAWLGKVQQGNDPVGRKAAVDRKNTIYTDHRRPKRRSSSARRAWSRWSGSRT